MIGRRRVAALLAVASCVALCGAPQRAVRADPPAGAPPKAAPTEAQFLASIERARVLLAAGDASGGQKLMDEALALHADQDYARAKRADLEDLARRLAFRVECPPPDPATLVKGTLKKFVSRTGDIEIRYAAGKPNDFEKLDAGGLAFPSRFSGPYTITVRGDAYPSTTDACPQVIVGMEEDPKTGRRKSWAVVPGIPPYSEGNQKVWLPARIVYHDGDDKKTVSEKATSPAKPGDAWRLKVQVTRGKVIASINDAPLGFATKPETVFGYAVIHAQNWSEIVIEGQVEPSWIQSKVDAIVEGKRAAFEARFDVRKRLPEWLYKEREGPAEDPSGISGVEQVPAAFRADVLRIRVLLLRDEDQEALTAVEALRARGAPEPLVSTLAARAHLGLDQPSLALADVERALAAAPDGLDALELKATILLRLGREEDSAALWEAAAKRPEATTEFFVAGAISLLVAGRLDSARRLTEGAARLGRRSEILDAIGRVLVQAANGPTWPKTYEYKTNNYHVQSDIDVETCSKAAMLLEEALQIYRDQVKPLKPEKRRLYKVYLFSGREGFLRYMADVAVLGGAATRTPRGSTAAS